MMIKKIFVILLAACQVVAQTQVDGWNNKVNNQIHAQARADRKIDKGIAETLDMANQPIKNNGLANKRVEETALTGKQLQVKYDFIPGEKVIYSNDFATDNMGELPTGWNTNGTGAVVKLNNFDGNWVQLYQSSAYLTDNKASFTENFTVEFDLVLHRTNPRAPFPEFIWGVLSSGKLSTIDNALLKNYMATFATEMNIQPSENSNASIHLQTYANGTSYLKTDIKKPVARLQAFNEKIHVAMQVQKERLRIWFNEEKLYDLPKAMVATANINQLYFIVKRYGGPEAEVGYAISNIKIAKGLPDTRRKLLDEGRFSTTGIRFNVNAPVLLPDSHGVLREIAAILTQNPELKINIIGHTDSDGDHAANLELSKKRAAAVKQALVNDYGIDANRMKTEGAGEQMPVNDNTTKEGKANNRRVEFVKL
ncbi:OmpA family protein [Emticicia sp. C21]|uniref:OmpA family protein n=1 Tax=Emticicia sp. C21 TaxID=2302915 RepID=UPI000E351300|nr:OmpA family protein [Emticicia sp. C21]RFS17551.1 OmpA family protein [Emticicia sp. C21]